MFRSTQKTTDNCVGYLVHVLLHHAGNAGASFVVPVEGPRQGTLAQEIDGQGLEYGFLVRHPHQHRLTPSIVHALERRDHGVDVARALHTAVHSPVRHLGDHLFLLTTMRQRESVQYHGDVRAKLIEGFRTSWTGFS